MADLILTLLPFALTMSLYLWKPSRHSSAPTSL